MGSRLSYRMSSEIFWGLMLRMCSKGRQQHLKTILAQAGGKAVRLAVEPAMIFWTVACSLVCQRNRMSTLLLSPGPFSTRVLLAAEEGHASAVAGFKKVTAEKKKEHLVGHREQAAHRKRMREGDAETREIFVTATPTACIFRHTACYRMRSCRAPSALCTFHWPWAHPAEMRVDEL